MKKTHIDYKQVKSLANIHCTDNEIAGVLGCPLPVLLSDKKYRAVYEQAKADACMSLRRLQWKAAESGNATILIFLGKQYLQQFDKQEVTHTGGIDLSHMSREELQEIIDANSSPRELQARKEDAEELATGKSKTTH